MGSKANSNAALGDVRSTSFDAASHRPEGYQGTIDDVLAQIRAEPETADLRYWPLNMSRERYELLGFLGVHKPRVFMSGHQEPSRIDWAPPPARVENDSVVYGKQEQPAELSTYSLEYALENFPKNFKVPS